MASEKVKFSQNSRSHLSVFGFETILSETADAPNSHCIADQLKRTIYLLIKSPFSPNWYSLSCLSARNSLQFHPYRTEQICTHDQAFHFMGSCRYAFQIGGTIELGIKLPALIRDLFADIPRHIRTKRHLFKCIFDWISPNPCAELGWNVLRKPLKHSLQDPRTCYCETQSCCNHSLPLPFSRVRFATYNRVTGDSVSFLPDDTQLFLAFE